MTSSKVKMILYFLFHCSVYIVIISNYHILIIIKLPKRNSKDKLESNLNFPELQQLHIHRDHENSQNQFTHQHSFYLFQAKQLPVTLNISKKFIISQVICFPYPLQESPIPITPLQFNSLTSLPTLNCKWERESRNFWARSHKPKCVGERHASSLLASLRNQKY